MLLTPLCLLDSVPGYLQPLFTSRRDDRKDPIPYEDSMPSASNHRSSSEDREDASGHSCKDDDPAARTLIELQTLKLQEERLKDHFLTAAVVVIEDPSVKRVCCYCLLLPLYALGGV